MFDEPRFSFIRPATKPLPANNGNGHKPEVISPGDASPRDEQKTHLKYALFFLVVAILLIIARQLGKDSPTSGQLAPMPNVHFDLSIQEPSGKVNGGPPSGYVVRFRLTNRGTRPVSCPVHTGSHVLIGHVVYRSTGQSEWMVSPWSFQPAAPSAQGPIDQDTAWIEMPPGGSIDGEFPDSGWPRGDHAYALDVKPEPNAKIVSLISPPYHLTPN